MHGTLCRQIRRRRFPRAGKIPAEFRFQRSSSEDAARVWLQRAIQAGGKDVIKKMALEDDDLKPLWAEIKNL